MANMNTATRIKASAILVICVAVFTWLACLISPQYAFADEPNGDDYYEILPVGNQDYALTAEDGENNGSLTLTPFVQGNLSQKWKLICIDEKSSLYQILPASGEISNQVLDVPNGVYRDGQSLQNYEQAEFSNQMFFLEANPDGSYTISPLAASNYALDVVNGELNEDTENVQLWTKSSFYGSTNTNQQFMFRASTLPGMEFTEAAVGDKLVYSVTQEVNDLGVNAFVRYEDMAMTDTLPEGLSYVSARMLNENGVDITNSAGSLSYNESTREVKFTFSSNYLSNSMPLNGESYTLEITTIIDSIPDSGKYENTGFTFINDTQLTSNKVTTPIIPPSFTIDKKADKDRYNLNDVITYTVNFTQTEDDAAAREVWLHDTIPDELNLVDGSIQVSGPDGLQYGVDGKKIWISLDRIAAGETISLTFQCSINEGSGGKTITNTAIGGAFKVDQVQDSTDIFVTAPVKYFVDGESTPCYIDENVVAGPVYQPLEEAVIAGTKPNCSGFEGWYLDPEYTIPYNPSTNGITTGGFNLYGRNKVTLSYQPTNTSFFITHTNYDYYLNSSLTNSFTNNVQILPEKETHYYGDTITFQPGENLYYEDAGATRTVSTTEGAYSNAQAQGNVLYNARLTSNATVYLHWVAGDYDGIYGSR